MGALDAVDLVSMVEINLSVAMAETDAVAMPETKGEWHRTLTIT